MRKTCCWSATATRYVTSRRALGVDTKAWLEMSVRNAGITRIGIEADGRFKVIAVGEDGFPPPVDWRHR